MTMVGSNEGLKTGIYVAGGAIVDGKQFQQLMNKLEEIRCCIIDVETALEKPKAPGQSQIFTGYDGQHGEYVSVNGRHFYFQDKREAKLFHAQLLILST